MPGLNRVAGLTGVVLGPLRGTSILKRRPNQRRLLRLATLLRHVAALGVVFSTVLALPVAASAQSVKADFNGDGRADLAVGVPAENLGSIFEAGAVNVIYGSASELTAAGNQFLNQDTPGI